MFAIFQYPFIQNAFIAGSIVAIVAAVLGYFLIVRGLSFAGHALSSIGFAGAAGAVLLGVSPIYGLMVFTVTASIAISILGREVRERDVATGVIMTFALGLGILFLSLYHGYAEQAYSILFGTIVGVSRDDVVFTLILGLILLIVIAIIGRPLLFSSFDAELAETRGVPVRALGSIFSGPHCVDHIHYHTSSWNIACIRAADRSIRNCHSTSFINHYKRSSSQSFWDSLTPGWEFYLVAIVRGRLAFSLPLYLLVFIYLFDCYPKESIQKDQLKGLKNYR